MILAAYPMAIPVLLISAQGANSTFAGTPCPAGVNFLFTDADFFFHGDASGGQVNMTASPSPFVSIYQNAGTPGASQSTHWYGFHLLRPGQAVRMAITVGTYDVWVDGWQIPGF
jgi:hypothetical protein